MDLDRDFTKVYEALELIKEDDIVIPWHLIECIGEDTILVKLSQQELSCCVCPRKRHRKFRF